MMREIYISSWSLIFITLLFSFSCSAQSSGKFTVQPFWVVAEKLTYDFTMELDAEGESTIDKTIFQNTLTLEKVNASNEKVLIKMAGENATCSNPAFSKDGDGNVLSALLGIDMLATFSKEGKLINFENKDEIISQFNSGWGESPSPVDNMVSENDSLVFSKIYETNYSGLFKNVGEQYAIPGEINRDTIKEGTEESGKIDQSTKITISKKADLISMVTIVKSQIGKFTENGRGYSFVNYPVTSETIETIQWNGKGLIERLELKNVMTYGGFVMLIDGKEMDKPSPTTVYTNFIFQLKSSQ